jgi:hypothetical protein
VWEAHEYDKLTRYDGTTADQAKAQAFAPFLCHQRDGNLCAGWVGCHDMDENLAIRMNASWVDVPAVLQYECPVLLFASGTEAAEHGKRDIDGPSPAARRKIRMLTRLQGQKGPES